MLRSRINRSLFLAVAAWAILSAQPAHAQTAVVTLKSVESLLSDVEYVMNLVGKGDKFKEFKEMIETGVQKELKDLKGLDLKRPIGAFVVGVPHPPENPKFVGFIPVTKEEEFIDFLKNLGQDPEKTGEHAYKISLPFATAFVRFANNYAYVSDSDANLGGTLPNPATFLPASNKNNLLAATVRLDQIPKEMKQMALKELDKEIEREGKKKSHETEAQFQFRSSGMKMAREIVGMVMDDAQEGALSFNIDRTANNLVWDLSMTPKADSKLAGKIRDFAPAGGLAPVHFEIAVGKLGLLLMPDGDQGKYLEGARKVFKEAAKDNQARVRFSFAGGDALHLRFEVSTHLLKLGEVFQPLTESDE